MPARHVRPRQKRWFPFRVDGVTQQVAQAISLAGSDRQMPMSIHREESISFQQSAFSNQFSAVSLKHQHCLFGASAQNMCFRSVAARLQRCWRRVDQRRAPHWSKTPQGRLTRRYEKSRRNPFLSPIRYAHSRSPSTPRTACLSPRFEFRVRYAFLP